MQRKLWVRYSLDRLLAWHKKRLVEAVTTRRGTPRPLGDYLIAAAVLTGIGYLMVFPLILLLALHER